MNDFIHTIRINFTYPNMVIVSTTIFQTLIKKRVYVTFVDVKVSKGFIISLPLKKPFIKTLNIDSLEVYFKN